MGCSALAKACERHRSLWIEMTTGGSFVRRSQAASADLPPLDWQTAPGVPRPCAAVLGALKFTTVSLEALRCLSADEWKQALDFSDSSQITLLVGNAGRGEVPPPVAERIRRNLEANAVRIEQLQREYFPIARGFEAASVEHVVLKGFAQAPWFLSDLRLRPQYDLDLWCPEHQLGEAQRVLTELGFESITAQGRFPTDHLPPMVRKTGWEWRGDYFDPQLPPVVELHFRLWDEATERFGAPGIEQFWARRVRRQLGDETIPVLHAADQFAFAALHLLRHLLRGNLKALHVYEIAYFLDKRQGDAAFWDEWRELHPAGLRELQTLACCLARKWFGCGLPAAVAGEVERLRPEVRVWFESYAACGVESRFRASKDELWLHLALLPSLKDQLAVVRRRLIPLTLPGRVDSAFVPERQRSLARRLRGAVQHALAAGSRVLYHLRSYGPVLRGAVRWRRLQREVRDRADLASASR
jgi:hypothetical protein